MLDVRKQVTKFKAYTKHNFTQLPQVQSWTEERINEVRVLSEVLPFRVNTYVASELIDWDNHEEDPIFNLVFPRRDMLSPEAFKRIEKLLLDGAPRKDLNTAVKEVRASLNPHPAGQQTLNQPILDEEPLEGMQHKYRETILFFPVHGQYCHSYCTFCFRWAQFVGDKDLLIATKSVQKLIDYLRLHPEITDIIFTGGDPMVMKTNIFKEYITPLLKDPTLSHIKNIRIGTKSLTYWPQRYVTDEDSQELLQLFEKVVDSGKHLAIMSHINHWKELETPIVQEAVKRIRATGANIRSQAPVIKHINDDADTWARMWRTQLTMGIVPYYMFVERDTGPKNYFEVPLARLHQIYRNAAKQVSGLGRTARGPSMSTSYGKVEVLGVVEVKGEKVFNLRFLQGRNPDWTYRPFFAKYCEKASWLDDLKPAFGEEKFFFED